ncbi:MAG: hypothetical protein ABWY63_08815 [Hyphomicrobiaceae bacterium]
MDELLTALEATERLQRLHNLAEGGVEEVDDLCVTGIHALKVSRNRAQAAL